MYSRRFKWMVRTVAAAVVVSMAWQDVLFAAGGVPTWTSVKTRGTRTGDLSKIEVPYDAGVARAVKPSDSDEIVVNIQDAHASLDAQKSIVRMLESLVKNYDLDLVGLEGAAGRVDASLVSSFPMEKVREAAAEALLAETQISAGEFYQIASGGAVELYGVEDLDLYKKNVASYRRVLANQTRVRTEMTNLAGAIEKIRERVFSAELSRIEKAAQSYRSGETKFADYWKSFRADAAAAGVGTEGYPNAAKLAATVDLEAEIDFSKADAQRDALIKELRRTLEADSFHQIELAALQFKLGKITPARFHADLVERAKNAGIAPEAFGDFILYAQYLMLFEEIDLVRIFEELEAIEERVKDKMFSGEEDRLFDRTQKAVRVFAKLLEATMTSADDRFYSQNPELFGVERLRRYVEEMGLRHGADYASGVDWEFLSGEVPAVEEFYRDVKARNDAMLSNLVARMKEKNQKIAAIVTGGFHSEGLSELMENRRISHIVMMPKFEEKSGERPYLAVITERGSYLDAELRFRAQEDAVALVVGLAALGGMKFEEAKRLYAESYRGLPDQAPAPSSEENESFESPAQSDAAGYANVASMSILPGEGTANLAAAEVLETAENLIQLSISPRDVEIAIQSPRGARAVRVTKGNSAKNVPPSVSPSRYAAAELALKIQGAELRAGARALAESAVKLTELSDKIDGAVSQASPAQSRAWLQAALDAFEYEPSEATDADAVRHAFFEALEEAQKLERRRSGAMPFKIDSAERREFADKAAEKILKLKAEKFAEPKAVETAVQPKQRVDFLLKLSETQRLEPSVELLDRMNAHFGIAGSRSALTMRHLLRDLAAVKRERLSRALADAAVEEPEKAPAAAARSEEAAVSLAPQVLEIPFVPAGEESAIAGGRASVWFRAASSVAYLFGPAALLVPGVRAQSARERRPTYAPRRLARGFQELERRYAQYGEDVLDNPFFYELDDSGMELGPTELVGSPVAGADAPALRPGREPLPAAAPLGSDALSLAAIDSVFNVPLDEVTFGEDAPFDSLSVNRFSDGYSLNIRHRDPVTGSETDTAVILAPADAELDLEIVSSTAPGSTGSFEGEGVSVASFDGFGQEDLFQVIFVRIRGTNQGFAVVFNAKAPLTQEGNAAGFLPGSVQKFAPDVVGFDAQGLPRFNKDEAGRPEAGVFRGDLSEVTYAVVDNNGRRVAEGTESDGIYLIVGKNLDRFKAGELVETAPGDKRFLINEPQLATPIVGEFQAENFFTPFAKRGGGGGGVGGPGGGMGEGHAPPTQAKPSPMFRTPDPLSNSASVDPSVAPSAPAAPAPAPSIAPVTESAVQRVQGDTIVELLENGVLVVRSKKGGVLTIDLNLGDSTARIGTAAAGLGQTAAIEYAGDYMLVPVYVYDGEPSADTVNKAKSRTLILKVDPVTGKITLVDTVYGDPNDKSIAEKARAVLAMHRLTEQQPVSVPPAAQTDASEQDAAEAETEIRIFDGGTPVSLLAAIIGGAAVLAAFAAQRIYANRQKEGALAKARIVFYAAVLAAAVLAGLFVRPGQSPRAAIRDAAEAPLAVREASRSGVPAAAVSSPQKSRLVEELGGIEGEARSVRAAGLTQLDTLKDVERNAADKLKNLNWHISQYALMYGTAAGERRDPSLWGDGYGLYEARDKAKFRIDPFASVYQLDEQGRATVVKQYFTHEEMPREAAEAVVDASKNFVHVENLREGPLTGIRFTVAHAQSYFFDTRDNRIVARMDRVPGKDGSPVPQTRTFPSDFVSQHPLLKVHGHQFPAIATRLEIATREEYERQKKELAKSGAISPEDPVGFYELRGKFYSLHRSVRAEDAALAESILMDQVPADFDGPKITWYDERGRERISISPTEIHAVIGTKYTTHPSADAVALSRGETQGKLQEEIEAEVLNDLRLKLAEDRERFWTEGGGFVWKPGTTYAPASEFGAEAYAKHDAYKQRRIGELSALIGVDSAENTRILGLLYEVQNSPIWIERNPDDPEDFTIYGAFKPLATTINEYRSAASGAETFLEPILETNRRLEELETLRKEKLEQIRDEASGSAPQGARTVSMQTFETGKLSGSVGKKAAELRKALSESGAAQKDAIEPALKSVDLALLDIKRTARGKDPFSEKKLALQKLDAFVQTPPAEAAALAGASAEAFAALAAEITKLQESINAEIRLTAEEKAKNEAKSKSQKAGISRRDMLRTVLGLGVTIGAVTGGIEAAKRWETEEAAPYKREDVVPVALAKGPQTAFDAEQKVAMPELVGNELAPVPPAAPQDRYAVDVDIDLTLGVPVPEEGATYVAGRAYKRLFGENKAGDDGLGRQWVVVIDKKTKHVHAIVVQNVLGSPQRTLSSNLQMTDDTGAFRPIDELIAARYDAATDTFKPFPAGTKIRADIDTEIQRDADNVQIGSETYTIDHKGGFTPDMYPADTANARFVDADGRPLFRGKDNPYYVAKIEQRISLGAMRRPDGQIIYRVSENRTFLKHADGSILKNEDGEPQYEKRIEWADPAGLPLWVFDGEVLIRIVYINGVEAYQIAMAVPDKYYDEFNPDTEPARMAELLNRKTPESAPKEGLVFISKNFGDTGPKTLEDGTNLSSYQVVRKQEFITDEEGRIVGISEAEERQLIGALLENPESAVSIALLRKARSNSLFVYYGDYGLTAGFVKYVGATDTAQVTVLHRRMGSESREIDGEQVKGRAQIEGRTRYDVWDPPIELDADGHPTFGAGVKPPRLEALVNSTAPNGTPVMVVSRGYTSEHDGKNRPVESAVVYMYDGTTPISSDDQAAAHGSGNHKTMPLKYTRDSKGRLLTREAFDFSETLERDRLGRPIFHYSEIRQDGEWVRIAEAVQVGVDADANVVWFGLPTAAASAGIPNGTVYTLNENGDRPVQVDGLVREPGRGKPHREAFKMFAAQQISIAKHNHGPWAELGISTSIDSYGVLGYDTHTHKAQYDAQGGLVQSRRVTKIDLEGDKVHVYDRNWVDSRERERVYDATGRITDETSGIPQSRNWRLVTHSYNGVESLPRETSLSFEGRSIEDTRIDIVDISDPAVNIDALPEPVTRQLVQSLAEARLVEPNVALKDSGLKLARLRVTNQDDGETDEVYMIAGDPLERKVYAGRYRDAGRIIDAKWGRDGRVIRTFRLTPDKQHVMSEYITDESEAWEEYSAAAALLPADTRDGFTQNMKEEFGDAPLRVSWQLPWYGRTNADGSETYDEPPAAAKSNYKAYSTRIRLLGNHPFYNNFLSQESPDSRGRNVSVNIWYTPKPGSPYALKSGVKAPPGYPPAQYLTMLREEGFGKRTQVEAWLTYSHAVNFNLMSSPATIPGKVVDFDSVQGVDYWNEGNFGRIDGFRYDAKFSREDVRDIFEWVVLDLSSNVLLSVDQYRVGERVRGRSVAYLKDEAIHYSWDDPRQPVFGRHVEYGEITRRWGPVQRDHVIDDKGHWAAIESFRMTSTEPMLIYPAYVDRQAGREVKLQTFDIIELFRDGVRVDEYEPDVLERIAFGRKLDPNDTSWTKYSPNPVILGGAGAFLLGLPLIVALVRLAPSIVEGLGSAYRTTRRTVRRLPPLPPSQTEADAPAAPSAPESGSDSPSGARISAAQDRRLTEIGTLQGRPEVEAYLRAKIAEVLTYPNYGFPDGSVKADERTVQIARESVIDTLINMFSEHRNGPIGVPGVVPEQEAIDTSFKHSYDVWQNVVLAWALENPEHQQILQEELEAPLTVHDMFLYALVAQHHSALLHNHNQTNFAFFEARRAVREARKQAAAGVAANPDIFTSTERNLKRFWTFVKIHHERRHEPEKKYGINLNPFSWRSKGFVIEKEILTPFDRLTWMYVFGNTRAKITHHKRTQETQVTGEDVGKWFMIPTFVKLWVTDAEYRKESEDYLENLIWLFQPVQDYRGSDGAGPGLAALTKNLPNEVKDAVVGTLASHTKDNIYKGKNHFDEVRAAALAVIAQASEDPQMDGNAAKKALTSKLAKIKIADNDPLPGKTMKMKQGGFLGWRGYLSIASNQYQTMVIPYALGFYSLFLGNLTGFQLAVTGFFAQFGVALPAMPAIALWAAGLGVLIAVLAAGYIGIRNVLRVIPGVTAVYNVFGPAFKYVSFFALRMELLSRTLVISGTLGALSVGVYQALLYAASEGGYAPDWMPLAQEAASSVARVFVAVFVYAIPAGLAFMIVKVMWEGLKDYNTPTRADWAKRSGDYYFRDGLDPDLPVSVQAGQTSPDLAWSKKLARYAIIWSSAAGTFGIMQLFIDRIVAPIQTLFVQEAPTLEMWTGKTVVSGLTFNNFEALLWMTPIFLIFVLTYNVLVQYMFGVMSTYQAARFNYNGVRGWFGLSRQNTIAEEAAEESAEALEKAVAEREAGIVHAVTRGEALQATLLAERLRDLTGARVSVVKSDYSLTEQEMTGFGLKPDPAAPGASVYERMLNLGRLSGAQKEDLLRDLNRLVSENAEQRDAAAYERVKHPDNLHIYDELVDMRNVVRSSIDPRWAHRNPPKILKGRRANSEELIKYKLLRNTVFRDRDGRIIDDPIEDRRRLDVAYANHMDTILQRMQKSGQIGLDEYEKSRPVIEGRVEGDGLSGVVTRRPKHFRFKTYAATRSLEFYLSSFQDERMPFTPPVDEMNPIAVIIPVYLEDPMETFRLLNTLSNNNKASSKLSEMVENNHAEWLMAIDAWVDEGLIQKGGDEYWTLVYFGHGQNLETGEAKGAFTNSKYLKPITRPALQFAVRYWAAQRFQELARTVEGVENGRAAMEFFVRTAHPYDTDSQIRERVNALYRFDLAHQPHGNADLQTPGAEHYEKLLAVFKIQAIAKVNMDITYVFEDPNSKRFYQVIKHREPRVDGILRALGHFGVLTGNPPAEFLASLDGRTSRDILLAFKQAGYITMDADAAISVLRGHFEHDREAFLNAAFPDPVLPPSAEFNALSADQKRMLTDAVRDARLQRTSLVDTPFDAVLNALSAGNIVTTRKELPGNPIMAGKGDNVANVLGGNPKAEDVVTMDVNQYLRPTEAFKLGSWLAVLKGGDRLNRVPAEKISKITATEHVMTEKYSIVGLVYSFVNLTFEFLCWTLSHVGIHLDYGHNNAMRRNFAIKTGPYSQPKTTDDLPPGQLKRAMGFVTITTPWMEFDKARETAFVKEAKMLAKFAFSVAMMVGPESWRDWSPQFLRDTPTIDWSTGHLNTIQHGGYFLREVLVRTYLAMILNFVITYALSVFVVLPNPIAWGIVGIFMSFAILLLLYMSITARFGVVAGTVVFLAIGPFTVLVFLGILSFTALSVQSAVQGSHNYLPTLRGLGNEFLELFMPAASHPKDKGTLTDDARESWGMVRTSILRFSLAMMAGGFVGIYLYQTGMLLLSGVFFLMPVMGILAVMLVFNHSTTPISGFWGTARIYFGDNTSPAKIWIRIKQMFGRSLYQVDPDPKVSLLKYDKLSPKTLAFLGGYEPGYVEAIEARISEVKAELTALERHRDRRLVDGEDARAIEIQIGRLEAEMSRHSSELAFLKQKINDEITRMTGAIEKWMIKLWGAVPFPFFNYRVPEDVMRPSLAAMPVGATFWTNPFAFTLSKISSYARRVGHFTLLLGFGVVILGLGIASLAALAPFRLVYWIGFKTDRQARAARARIAAGVTPPVPVVRQKYGADRIVQLKADSQKSASDTSSLLPPGTPLTLAGARSAIKKALIAMLLSMPATAAFLPAQEKPAPEARQPAERQVETVYNSVLEYGRDAEGNVIRRYAATPAGDKIVETRGPESSLFYMPADRFAISEIIRNNQMSVLVAPLLGKEDPFWSDKTPGAVSKEDEGSPLWNEQRAKVKKMSNAELFGEEFRLSYAGGHDRSTQKSGEIKRIIDMGYESMMMWQFPNRSSRMTPDEAYRTELEIERIDRVLDEVNRIYRAATGRDLIIHQQFSAGRFDYSTIGYPYMGVSPYGTPAEIARQMQLLNGPQRADVIEKLAAAQERTVANSAETWSANPWAGPSIIANEDILYILGVEPLEWAKWEGGYAFRNRADLDAYLAYVARLAAAHKKAEQNLSKRLGRTISHSTLLGVGDTGIGKKPDAAREKAFVDAFIKANAPRADLGGKKPFDGWKINFHPLAYAKPGDIDPADYESVVRGRLAQIIEKSERAGVVPFFGEGIAWPDMPDRRHLGLSPFEYSLLVRRIVRDDAFGRIAGLGDFKSHFRMPDRADFTDNTAVDLNMGNALYPNQSVDPRTLRDNMPKLIDELHGRTWFNETIAQTALDEAWAREDAGLIQDPAFSGYFYNFPMPRTFERNGGAAALVLNFKDARLEGQNVLVRLLPAGSDLDDPVNLLIVQVKNGKGVISFLTPGWVPSKEFPSQLPGPYRQIATYTGDVYADELAVPVKLAPKEILPVLTSIEYQPAAVSLVPQLGTTEETAPAAPVEPADVERVPFGERAADWFIKNGPLLGGVFGGFVALLGALWGLSLVRGWLSERRMAREVRERELIKKKLDGETAGTKQAPEPAAPQDPAAGSRVTVDPERTENTARVPLVENPSMTPDAMQWITNFLDLTRALAVKAPQNIVRNAGSEKIEVKIRGNNLLLVVDGAQRLVAKKIGEYWAVETNARLFVRLRNDIPGRMYNVYLPLDGNRYMRLSSLTLEGNFVDPRGLLYGDDNLPYEAEKYTVEFDVVELEHETKAPAPAPAPAAPRTVGIVTSLAGIAESEIADTVVRQSNVVRQISSKHPGRSFEIILIDDKNRVSGSRVDSLQSLNPDVKIRAVPLAEGETVSQAFGRAVRGAGVGLLIDSPNAVDAASLSTLLHREILSSEIEFFRQALAAHGGILDQIDRVAALDRMLDGLPEDVREKLIFSFLPAAPVDLQFMQALWQLGLSKPEDTVVKAELFQAYKNSSATQQIVVTESMIEHDIVPMALQLQMLKGQLGTDRVTLNVVAEGAEEKVAAWIAEGKLPADAVAIEAQPGIAPAALAELVRAKAGDSATNFRMLGRGDTVETADIALDAGAVEDGSVVVIVSEGQVAWSLVKLYNEGVEGRVKSVEIQALDVEKIYELMKLTQETSAIAA